MVGDRVVLAPGPVALALALALAAGCHEHGGQEILPPPPEEAWAQYCALCHGDDGEGYTADNANAIANQEFLTTATDELIETAIRLGRPGTSMSAWSTLRGGPLSPTEIDALVAWIRRWQTEPSVDVSDVVVDGVPDRGQPLWEFQCALCHGPHGEGGTFGSVASPTFLSTASDGFLRHAIAKGRPGTDMEAFEDRITAQGIDDLVALVRSWEQPVDDTFVPAPELDPDTLVIHPDGPVPALGDERLVSVDVVAAELERGAALVLLDARPPADYVRGHITGAISVPFYAVEAVVDQLPADRWFVTYCACPHAEAMQAADILEAHGLPHVRVLDEGVRVWAERGYPMHEGAEP